MIGNDVVDIMQSRHESNWQRTGFLEKLFTIDEQHLIRENADPERTVWLLWSMKEAAYKIYNREIKERSYIPKKLVCSILMRDKNYITGKVSCFENVYHTKTIISKESLHTIAVSNSAHLNHVIEIEKKGIVKDHNGIPYLLPNAFSTTIQDVSISHHGRFEKVVTIRV